MLNWAYLPYTLPLILCGALALAVGIYAGRHRELRGRSGSCGSAWPWPSGHSPMPSMSPAQMATKIFWSKFEYLGIVSGPLVWLSFALHYTRREQRVPHSISGHSASSR